MIRDLVYDLKCGAVVLTFVKADGSDRKMLCTLRADMMPEMPNKEDAERPLAEDYQPVWDLEMGAWRAYKPSKVREWYPVKLDQ